MNMRIFYINSGRLTLKAKLIIGGVMAMSMLLLTLLVVLVVGAMVFTLPVV